MMAFYYAPYTLKKGDVVEVRIAAVNE